MERPAQLVFIPAAGTGHIVPTVEIAKLLVDRYDHLSITVLVMKLPFNKPFNAAANSSTSKRIRFVILPEPQIDTRGLPPSFITQSFVKAHKNHVKDAVAKLLTESTQSESTPTRVAGLVVDMFCTTMVDVADELGIPSYVFFTSSAACLAFWLQIQMLRDEGEKNVAELMDSDTELTLPSFVNPVPGGVASSVLIKKDLAESFLYQVRRFRQSKGILVNTFMELESGALSLLSDGKTPPVYPVGPLLNFKTDRDDDKVLDILRWLDDQPPLSVVFLCFGSMGFLGEAQTREIACALEQSRYRFLWSLRVAPTKGKDNMPSDCTHPTSVLPEGFLDRTAEIGKIIGWAPQMAILAHTAVGGFVSHCGWNSALESLWYNVPVATWPMYAEQQLNAFELVKELGLAVEVRKDNEVVVSAPDIEKGIRQVMKQDSNVRHRVKEMSEKSKKALRIGGSSYSFLRRFVDQI